MEDAPKYGQLLTRQDVHELCACVRELLRQRNELQNEVSELRESLSMFAALRDLMYDDAPALAHVASNGHVALPSQATVKQAPMREQGSPIGLLRTGDVAHEPPVGESQTLPHEDTAGAGEDLEVTAPDDNTGDGPIVESASSDEGVDAPAGSSNPDDDPNTDSADSHRDDTQATGAIELPGAETETGESIADMTLAMDPAANTPPVSPSVEMRPAPGTLLARILNLIEQSVRPKRPWQVQRELELPRLPSAELSKLVSQGHLVRVKEGCYGVVGRDYGTVASPEGN